MVEGTLLMRVLVPLPDGAPVTTGGESSVGVLRCLGLGGPRGVVVVTSVLCWRMFVLLPLLGRCCGLSDEMLMVGRLRCWSTVSPCWLSELRMLPGGLGTVSVASACCISSSVVLCGLLSSRHVIVVACLDSLGEGLDVGLVIGRDDVVGRHILVGGDGLVDPIIDVGSGGDVCFSDPAWCIEVCATRAKDAINPCTNVESTGVTGLLLVLGDVAILDRPFAGVVFRLAVAAEFLSDESRDDVLVRGGDLPAVGAVVKHLLPVDVDL